MRHGLPKNECFFSAANYVILVIKKFNLYSKIVVYNQEVCSSNGLFAIAPFTIIKKKLALAIYRDLIAIKNKLIPTKKF